MVRLPNGLLLRYRRAAPTASPFSTSASSLPRRTIAAASSAAQALPLLDKGKRPEDASCRLHLSSSVASRSFSTSLPRSLPPKKKAKATTDDAADGEAKPRTKGRKAKASTEASSSSSPNPPSDKPKRTRGPAKPVERPPADPNGPFPHLPKPDDWRAVFKIGSGFLKGYRYFVSSPQTTKSIVKKLKLSEGWVGKTKDGEQMGWTIIEAYAGPGTLTRELLAHRSVDKVISMEDNDSFALWLQTLKDSNVATSPKHKRALVDPNARLHVIQKSAYHWDTYVQMLEEGALDHLKDRIVEDEASDKTVEFGGKLVKKEHEGLGWENLSPLMFVAQLPNTVHGEQLFAQIVHAIASRMWLFQYGRVKMAFTCAESLAMRCLARPGDKQRSKLSVTVQTLCDVSLAIPSSDLTPHHEHFYPSHPSVGPRLPSSSNVLIPRSVSTEAGDAPKEKMAMIIVEPKAKPMVGRNELEAFEYVTRNLFILRSRSVEEALKHVAPGAANILAHLQSDSPSMEGRPKSECVPPSTLVSHLTNEQWVGLARVFEKWPFRPQNLFEEGRTDTSTKAWMR